MKLFDKGLKPLTISTALYKSVKTVIKHSMRNCTFTTTIYKTVKIERFTFVIVRLKTARLVNCTILGGSVFQIVAVLLIKRYLSTSLWDTEVSNLKGLPRVGITFVFRTSSFFKLQSYKSNKILYSVTCSAIKRLCSRLVSFSNASLCLYSILDNACTCLSRALG